MVKPAYSSETWLMTEGYDKTEYVGGKSCREDKGTCGRIKNRENKN
jgi:hypothetical protein